MSVTELLMVSGQTLRVQGAPEELEAKILDAARGSILELVWLTQAAGGTPLAMNPAHIVAMGATVSAADRGRDAQAERPRDGEPAAQDDIRDAVRIGDDDALTALVERLRTMRFIEVRRVLDGLEGHELRRVAETAIAPSR